ncbi:MAG: enoyl-CoA hydratase/isomerase family protein [Candidatus Marinimicrobia bacterium]|nr:enoyl-CoA hydratase/isomerase family protein [Candidatus Neomarinimicrobiota bacterium]
MKYIKTDISNGIGTITIDRPDALNAMNSEVVLELAHAFQSCINNESVGVLILTGTGEKAFVAGADIKSMQKMNPEQALEFGKTGQNMTKVIENSPKPVIAAVNGFALGGGCEIALACHIRVASENAQFAQPEVHLGIIPGWGGTQRLPKLVGQGEAIEMIVSGKMVSAEKALQIGLVNAVVSLDHLMKTVQGIAEAILRNGPESIALSLECIRRSSELTLVEGLDFEVKSFSHLFETAETKEGLTAFVEKRHPKFRV